MDLAEVHSLVAGDFNSSLQDEETYHDIEDILESLEDKESLNCLETAAAAPSYAEEEEEIKHEQGDCSCVPIIPDVPFARLVRETGEMFKNDLVFSKCALSALREASEDHLVEYLKGVAKQQPDSNCASVSVDSSQGFGKRVTVELPGPMWQYYRPFNAVLHGIRRMTLEEVQDIAGESIDGIKSPPASP